MRYVLSIGVLLLLSGCATTLADKTGVANPEGEVCGESNDAVDLVVAGDRLLLSGIQALYPRRDLESAVTCYGRALMIAPDSYDATLGMGVAFLTLAKVASDLENPLDPNRVRFLSTAKERIGQAYMLRSGQFEPLYYLAEVAAAEEDWSRAETYLAPLIEAKYKLGPVYALQAYMAEKRQMKAQAQELYFKALQAGWPAETMGYAAANLDEAELRRQGYGK